jgi:hypothetical protein
MSEHPLFVLIARRSQQTKLLKERRAAYTRMIPELYDLSDAERNEADRAALRQVNGWQGRCEAGRAAKQTVR